MNIQVDMRIEYEYDEETGFNIYTIKIFPDTDNCLASRGYIRDGLVIGCKCDILDYFIDENIIRGLKYYEKQGVPKCQVKNK
jgi:hypothetical protein